MKKSIENLDNLNTKTKGTSRLQNVKVSDTIMVNERKRKRKKNKIITIVIIVIIIVVCCYLLLNLAQFNLINVTLSNAENCTKEEILDKIGIKTGKNIFIEFFKCNRKNASTLPYVEDIKLKIVLPNQIDIDIIERTGKYFAYDKDTNSFYKISEDGYILEKVNIDDKKQDEVLLLGVTFDDNVSLGNKINDIDLSKIEIYKKIEKSYENKKINGIITKVSFENSLTTITINDKLSVIFPNDTQLEYKMSFLKEILSKIGEDSVGVIDMTKTNPTYSSF